MTQDTLWDETIFDATRSLVDALGGPKRVAAEMWPARSMAEGQRYLLKCLDTDRPEKLGMDELMWLMRRGRLADCHVLADFIARECLYEFRVVAPDERKADLTRQMEQTMGKAADLLRQWERLQGA
jgi:hypothetical protein